jgi:hypothetical protein
MLEEIISENFPNSKNNINNTYNQLEETEAEKQNHTKRHHDEISENC